MLTKINMEALPTHIGIIMDGNGRWAKKRKKPRTAGHREGLNAAKRIVKAAAFLGIRFITLYTFSTENWKRSKDEVAFLMKLIQYHLRKEMDFYRENKMKVVHTGDIRGLPDFVQQELRTAIFETKDFDKITVNLAINYGGRDEIIRGFHKILNNDNVPFAPRELTVSSFHGLLDCPEIPDPDLIIRTAGEKRISNFLLWQSAYSELFFSTKLWPDWKKEDLYHAIHDYQKRTRKYGGIL